MGVRRRNLRLSSSRVFLFSVKDNAIDFGVACSPGGAACLQCFGLPGTTAAPLTHQSTRSILIRRQELAWAARPGLKPSRRSAKPTFSSSPPRSAPASDENRIIDVLNATFDAERADFNRLVLLVHPQTQHLFRDILSARTDELLRSYPQAQISVVSGLATHPKDLALSDAEFFVITCNNVKTRHPDWFSEDSTPFPLTLEGTTFDSDQRAHVVLSWPGSVHTERTDFNFVGSFHLFLKHEHSQWLIWSCPFARRIGAVWSDDLAKLYGAGSFLR